MNAFPAKSVAIPTLALVALLIVSGVACLAIGQKDTGNSLVSLGIGIVLGGGVATGATAIANNGATGAGKAAAE